MASGQIAASVVSLLSIIASLVLTCLFVFHYSNLQACTYGRNKNGMCYYSDLTARATSTSNSTIYEFTLTSPLNITSNPSGLSEQLVVQYPSGTSVREYLVDFDYTSDVPSGGQEYPTSTVSSGFFYNSQGVSVYFKYYYNNNWGDNLTNVSNLFKRALISNNGPGYSKINTSDGTSGFAVRTIPFGNNNHIYISSFEKTTENFQPPSFFGVSTNNQTKSVFTNFSSDTNIVNYSVGQRNLYQSYNPMDNILAARQRHLNGCAKDSTKCFCVEPGFVIKPDGNNYTYDEDNDQFERNAGVTDGPSITKVVSLVNTTPDYSVSANTSNKQTGGQLTVQSSLGTFQEPTDGSYSFKIDGNATSFGQQQPLRYNRELIFCSNLEDNFKPALNQLYGEDWTVVGSLGTSVYVSSKANAEKDLDGQIYLGFADK
jgi:hypothetical protein